MSKFTLEEIYRKAAQDPDFRDQLKADPVAALGLDRVPKDLEIVICEDTATKVHVPIPPANLTSEELAGVAGGISPVGMYPVHSSGGDDLFQG